MLMLLFHVDKDLYAVESSCVVEVIPRIPLKTVHHVPSCVAGLFNYRSTIVPVIDFCHLIRGTSSRFSLSTRIIMVTYPYKGNLLQYLGLIAERVTETANMSENEFVDSCIRVKEAPFISGMIMDKKGIVQRIHLERLFADAQNTYLLAAGGYSKDEFDSH